jgi:hypothetical protein
MSVDKTQSPRSAGSQNSSPSTKTAETAQIGSTTPIPTPPDKKTTDSSSPKPSSNKGKEGDSSIMASITGELNNYAHSASSTLSEFLGKLLQYFISSLEELKVNQKFLHI